MSPKFMVRTFRNIVFRNLPYFAHLAITHVCNLRCRFCQIPETLVKELDTEGMKRVVDVLDRMGIAVLSVSGGGEPLLRPDFATILNCAAERGMYTKITSNGTMPPAKYQELLDSKVAEVAISLDGVQGNDLPYSHVGPKVLRSIRYLNDHLPCGKRLTINITISQANRDQVGEIVAYCGREFPRAGLWLNPVVVGTGKLRVSSQLKVNPDYLRRVDSPKLLTTEFFRRGAEEYFGSETYNWGCLAGELFFDIKPNGDFWICQDHPAKMPLNILDPDFVQKWRRADFSHRRACSGCTYSCYFVTQKSFEPRNWRDMAVLWWKSNTAAADPCRGTARDHGWLAGLLHYSASRLLAALRKPALAAMVLLAVAGVAGAQGTAAAPAPAEILTQMEKCNVQRREALAAYQNRRRYFAATSFLHRQAYLVVEERFRAPQEKCLRVLERGGSPTIEQRVFTPLLKNELSNARPTACGVVDFCRPNYTFTFMAFDPGAKAYIFQIDPRSSNRYLVRGKLWIDAEDFAIRRVEGEPAQRPSFWVRRTHLVHEYGKFGNFWFPIRTSSEVELLMFGRAILRVDYFGYQWQSREEQSVRLLPGP